MRHPFLSLMALCALQVAGAQDYAPLQAGNTWTYRGSQGGSAANNSWQDSVLRVVVVASATQGGFVVNIRDSLYGRYDGSGARPDSIVTSQLNITESSSGLNGGGLLFPGRQPGAGDQIATATFGG